MAGLRAWAVRVTAGYPGVEVRDWTESWRDGRAFAALIARFRPELINFSDLGRKAKVTSSTKGDRYVIYAELPVCGWADLTAENCDPVSTCQTVFSLAERELDIPALLDPADMAAQQLDSRSIVTYVAQFYHKVSTY